MPSPDLFPLVQQELTKGTPKETIQHDLLAKGYTPEDVHGALARATLPTSTPLLSHTLPTTQPLAKKHGHVGLLLGVSALFILVLGAGAYATYWYTSESLSQSKGLLAQILTNASNTPALLPLSTTVSPTTPAALPPAPAGTLVGNENPATPVTPSNEVGGSSVPSALTAVTATLPAPMPAPTATTDTTNTTPTTPAPEPTLSFSVDQSQIESGGTATLTWTATNADSCVASNGWSGTEPTAGSQALTGLVTGATYTLSCTGAGGTVTQGIPITIIANTGGGGGGGSTTTPAPTLSLTIDQSEIDAGGSPTISWTSTNTTDCTASNGWSGDQATSGTQLFSNLTSNVTYTLSCTGPGGTVTQSVPVTIVLSGTPPESCPTGDTGTYPNCVAPSSPSAPATTAISVYSGCATPSGTPGTIFYIDPVNGSDAGDGSQAHPWKTLQDVIDAGLISTMPTHYNNATHTTITNNPNAPIQPGDTIYLMSGDEGAVDIQGYYGNVNNPGYDNSDFITVEPAPGQSPTIDQLTLDGGGKWVFQNLTFESINNAGQFAYGGGPNLDYYLVLLEGPHNDIIFNDDTFMSQPNVSSWTPTDWRTERASGIADKGSSDSSCVAITNNILQNIGFGIESQSSNNVLISDNTINNFADDGIDYGSNNMLIENNTITNSVEDGDGFHRDGMQGQPYAESTVVNNITIQNNQITRTTTSNPYPSYMQGIDDFDGIFDNVIVEGNTVITDASQGISFYGAQGITIENNILLGDSGILYPCVLISPPVTPNAGILNCTLTGTTEYSTSTVPSLNIVDSKAKEPSTNVTISGNIATGLAIATDTAPMTVTNNLCLPTSVDDYKCIIDIPINGVAQFSSTVKTYPGNNIIPDFSASDLFTQYDPTDMLYNLTLKIANPALAIANWQQELLASVETGFEQVVQLFKDIFHVN